MALRLLVLALPLRAAASAVVETGFGSIRGREVGAGGGASCEAFLGVPFAEPPSRFEPPRAWSAPYGRGGLAAHRYGAWCPQSDGSGASGSEDCLFLNFWRPGNATAGDGLAMMVWIHGGGFVDGDAGDESEGNTYDGCGLAARHGVIVAGMNYRLGVLGFAALERADGGVDANFGMEDQREALRWLRDQAPAIGGDPARVTIFGESAGGMSVFHHLVSSRSAGLFRAAISESGLPTAAGREFSLGNTRAFARTAGCKRGEPVRACLLGKSVDELIQAQAAGGSPFASNSTGWGATVDGVDLTDYPRRLMAHRLKVPVLAGFNTNEGNTFLWPEYPSGMNSSQYYAFLRHVLTEFDPRTALSSAQLEEVFRRYPAAPEGDQRPVAARAFTDYGILCGTQCALSSAAPGKAYFYRFDHRPECPEPGPVPGVNHGVELPYVFGTPASYQCSFDAGEKALSDRMQRLWTDFAKHLAPAPSDESFPAFDRENMTNLVLRATSDSLESGYRADFCRFWSEIWQLSDDSPTLI